LIGSARGSIADPFLPSKIKENRPQDIRECIGCNICVSMDSYGLPVRCTQNPTISEEWRREWHPEKPPVSHNQQSHLIVGAGPAGLECALTLANSGDHVTIADAAHEVGGRVTLEARLPGLSSWIRVRDYRLQQLQKKANVDIYLSSAMNAADIADFGSDTVTLATGATWRRDGVGSSNFEPLNFGGKPVYTPDDLLTGLSLNQSASSVVVYDDEHFYMASVLAEKLCIDGHEVIYVTPMPSIATWTDNTLEQARIVQRLGELGVRLMPNLKLEDGAIFRDLLSGAVIDLEFSELIMVGARLPNDELYAELSTMSSVKNLYRCGDCVNPGIIQAATLSGHQIARNILNAGDQPLFKRDQITHS